MAENKSRFTVKNKGKLRGLYQINQVFGMIEVLLMSSNIIFWSESERIMYKERILKKLQIVFFILMTVDTLYMLIVQFTDWFFGWPELYSDSVFLDSMFMKVLDTPILYNLIFGFFFDVFDSRYFGEYASMAGWISFFLIIINPIFVDLTKTSNTKLGRTITAFSIINIILFIMCLGTFSAMV